MLSGLIGVVCAAIPSVETNQTAMQTMCLLFGGIATYGFSIIVKAASKYLDQ